jgi:glycosyltransferase involved in cell wall biosynthesis
MDRDALARLYASADICVLPSATETCGLVALEAMASGVPVIAADAGGLRDSIVPGETGILVPPHDASGFAAAITTLALDRERRCAIAATARAWAETRSLGYETARLLDDLHRTVASRDTQRPCTAA